MAKPDPTLLPYAPQHTRRQRQVGNARACNPGVTKTRDEPHRRRATATSTAARDTQSAPDDQSELESRRATYIQFYHFSNETPTSLNETPTSLYQSEAGKSATDTHQPLSLSAKLQRVSTKLPRVSTSTHTPSSGPQHSQLCRRRAAGRAERAVSSARPCLYLHDSVLRCRSGE